MKLKFIFVLIIGLYSTLTFSKLNIITTTPDLLWLVQSIGKDRVKAHSLLDGTEDPHFVDAMPSWIAKLSKADIFCMVGLELEIGWAPKILSRSNNPKIQHGSKGHCNVGQFVNPLEVPKGKIDRSMGDVHSGGNPHYRLGPMQYKKSAQGIFEILIQNDFKNYSYYQKNLNNLIKQIDLIKSKVISILSKKPNVKIMTYHKEFSYFLSEFKLTLDGVIEEVPGVPPSAGRIARVAVLAKNKKTDIVIASKSNPQKLLKRFYEISNVPFKQVSVSILKNAHPKNYEELLTGLANAIIGN